MRKLITVAAVLSAVSFASTALAMEGFENTYFGAGLAIVNEDESDATMGALVLSAGGTWQQNLGVEARLGFGVIEGEADLGWDTRDVKITSMFAFMRIKRV